MFPLDDINANRYSTSIFIDHSKDIHSYHTAQLICVTFARAWRVVDQTVDLVAVLQHVTIAA